jgi:hypothetical protein
MQHAGPVCLNLGQCCDCVNKFCQKMAKCWWFCCKIFSNLQRTYTQNILITFFNKNILFWHLFHSNSHNNNAKNVTNNSVTLY